LPMHMRFGLWNVVTMHAMFFVGRPAFMLTAMSQYFKPNMGWKKRSSCR
jgi:hypothetical protein